MNDVDYTHIYMSMFALIEDTAIATIYAKEVKTTEKEMEHRLLFFLAYCMGWSFSETMKQTCLLLGVSAGVGYGREVGDMGVE